MTSGKVREKMTDGEIRLTKKRKFVPKIGCNIRTSEREAQNFS